MQRQFYTGPDIIQRETVRDEIFYGQFSIKYQVCRLFLQIDRSAVRAE